MIEKIKGKYEVILGFVTLVLSFSAFKEEISKIALELGYAQINLADIFIVCIESFSISLYFYVLEISLRDTAIGGWKIFTYLITFGFYIFCLILVVPIFLSLNVLAIYLINVTGVNSSDIFSILINIGSIVSTLGVAYTLSRQIITSRKEKLETSTLINEVDRLSRAKNLINDGYYHHAVFEIYNVLVIALKAKLETRGYRISEQRLSQLIAVARAEGLINNEDANYIETLRIHRNEFAHLPDSPELDVSEATLAYSKVAQLLQKIKSQPN